MPGFVFKLQPLLDIKSQIEENLKIKLGLALKELERNKNILKAIKEEEYEHIEQFSKKAIKRLVVSELMEYSAYISYLNQKAEVQKENVKLAAINVDKVREELVDISKEREMLERLREKRYESYVYGQLREEQKLNDEIFSYKYISLSKVEN